MEKLLFVVLVITEIVFAIRAITSHVTKKKWSEGRGLVNAGEIIVYLLMIVLPGIDFSFRFKCLFLLLIIRLILSGIVFLASRKNDKSKKTVAIIIGTVFQIILIAIGMMPAFIFTDYAGRPVTGPYTVARSNAILVDEKRIEEFETDGSFREVPV